MCTVRDPDQETPKQFENRICALVGAQVNQSRTDGLYYLDVIRSVTDAELVDLPVISSDDILEFDQQPNVIAEADNVFIGKWRDPQTKSDRATRPLVSQAALRASGVRSEVVKEYYEIPTEELVLRVIEDMKRRFDLSGMTVGLLGMAFKAESDDVRASLSYKFKKVLMSQAKAVLTTDPFVKTDPDLVPLETVVAKSDLLILCAPHAAYKSADFKGKPVFDVWGHVDGGNVIK